MDTRGKNRTARSSSRTSRVRTRAQAAAEAQASSNNTSGPSSGTRSHDNPPNNRNKRSRTSRRVSRNPAPNPQNPPANPPPTVERSSKRTRRGDPNSAPERSSDPNPAPATRSSVPRISRRGRGRGRRPNYTRALRVRMEGGSDDEERSLDAPFPIENSRAGTVALHGILRSLGAGLDDVFSGNALGSGTRLGALLSSLRQPDDSSAHMDALTQLCEYLSVSTEESMVSFSVESFVPPLVAILNNGTPDTKLLSARAITHLMDALPNAASSISQHGASIPLCANLHAISFIDLAEQSLSALEKLSIDYPHPILRAGGFSASLSFIDFFSTGVQRVAAQTVRNLCRNPPLDSITMVVEVLPIMLGLLNSQDQRIREYMLDGFSKLADGFRLSTDILEQLCSTNGLLIESILELVVPPSPASLSSESYATAVHLLCTFARGSAALSSKITGNSTLIARMKQHLETMGSAHAFDFLVLADSLLPEVPDADHFSGSSSKPRRRQNSYGSNAALAAVDATRRKDLTKDSTHLTEIGDALVYPLMHFYMSCPNTSTRQLMLSVLVKFFAIAEGPLLNQMMLPKPFSGRVPETMSFCSFVVMILGENSGLIETSMGLSLVKLALRKIPKLKQDLIREGVFPELERISSSSPPEEPTSTKRGPHMSLRNPTFGVGSFNREGGLRTGIFNFSAQKLAERAKEIIETQITTDGVEISHLKTDLQELTKIRDSLLEASSDDDHATGFASVDSLLSKMTGDSGVSVYEFSSSGVIDGLFEFLIAPSRTDEIRYDRSCRFLDLLNTYARKNPFLFLLRRIIGSLSLVESLPLMIDSSMVTGFESTMFVGLRLLSQPFKLKLRRSPSDDSDDVVRDYANHVVLIEPLATMASVEEFLLSRIEHGSSSSMRRRAERQIGLFRNSSSASEGGDIEMMAADEVDSSGNELYSLSNPSDFAAARSLNGMERRVFGKSFPDFAAEGRLESSALENGQFEEDELNAIDPGFDLENDEEEEEEEDDDSPKVRPVLNEEKGPQTRRSSRSSAAKKSSEPLASASDSYAAVLTGKRSVRNKSAKAEGAPSEASSRQPGRIKFSLNNVNIPRHRSLIWALAKVRRQMGGSLSPALWNSVHVLTYSLGSEEGVAPPKKSTESLRRSSRLSNSSKSTVYLPPKEYVKPTRLGSELASSSRIITFSGTHILSALPENIMKYVAVLSYLKQLQKLALGHLGKGSELQALQADVGSDVDFVSLKIESKFKRQMADPLALCSGLIPRWCFLISRFAPFLLPFESRRLLFQSTALGSARALHLLQEREVLPTIANNSRSQNHRYAGRGSETRVGRIQRRKVRIHRDRLLDSATKVLTLYASDSTMLEVEYFDEVGTGLGPTLEFYTLVSRAVQRIDLELWRPKNWASNGQKTTTTSNAPSGSSGSVRRRTRSSLSKADGNPSAANDSKVYVDPSGIGLFPLATPAKHSPTVEHFTFIGRLVGKALADGRLLDLRLSTVFCELVLSIVASLEREKIINPLINESDDVLHPIGCGDSAEISRNIDSLDSRVIWDNYCAARSPLHMLRMVDPQLTASLEKLIGMLDKESDMISTLALSFTLPGDDSFELIENGKDVDVDASNVEDYVSRIAYHLLYQGVRHQADAFLLGFSEVLDVRSLSLMQPNELENLMCGPSFEQWTVEFLAQVTRCDHGYSHDSNAVLMLFNILSEFTPVEQRRFVLFLTGSPALPLGGLKRLSPRLTIVKRNPDGQSPDECLPTVMTCTNYFKLPDYSSQEVAKQRIVYAMEEGQGSFHLS